MNFNIRETPYSQLRYDRRHPALELRTDAHDVEIALTMLSRLSQARTQRGFGDPADFQLQPLIVYPYEDGAYTVMDGNLRLAYLQLCRDRALRRRARVKPLPELHDDDPAITVAVFPTRLDAYPHVLRLASPTNQSDWRHDHWASAIIQAVGDGYPIAQISANTGFDANNVASIAESHNALNQMLEAHPKRWHHHDSSHYLREAFRHPSLRRNVGLPDHPETSLPAKPLPSSENYRAAQMQLFDFIYGTSLASTAIHDAQSGSSISDLAYIHSDPEMLVAYRNRRRRHYNTAEFIQDHRGEPSIDVIRTQIHHVTSMAEHFLSTDETVTRALVKVAQVTYSINQEDQGLYVVQLSSPYPDRFRQLAQRMETHIRHDQPRTIVEFW